MKKELCAISISLVLSLISFSGCIEETPPGGETNNVKNPKMVYVDDDGGADYSKIQDAIDYVLDGGTIFVNNGIYYETLLIDKSISLIGSDQNNTIIDHKIETTALSDNVILISADNCTINGFSILCINYISDVTGIKISSSNNTISNNTITYAYRGIYLDYFSKNNTISWNTILGVSHGISTYGSDKNNIFRNNISKCKTYGFYLVGSDNNTISNNMISDNSLGIRLQASTNCEIFGNTIKNCSQGIRLCCGAKTNVLYYNVFQHNRDYNSHDEVTNQWDNGSIGNYWDDYTVKYPYANQIDGIWDTPYNITGGDNFDRFPLVNPVDF